MLGLVLILNEFLLEQNKKSLENYFAFHVLAKDQPSQSEQLTGAGARDNRPLKDHKAKCLSLRATRATRSGDGYQKSI